MEKIDSDIYREFLTKIDVDVIHIHTLMGLHKEFFSVAKEKKIRIIFTSHDYFGLSPVPDFYIDNKSWDSNNTNEFWNRCTGTAMSQYKLRIFQLSFYPLIRKIVNRIKGSKENNKKIDDSNSISNIDFSLLKKYYENIFKLVDFFHFNSDIAKNVYCENLRFIDEKKYEVISITNSSITKHYDRKKEKCLIETIAYIGPYKKNKGFYDYIDFAKKKVMGIILFSFLVGMNPTKFLLELKIKGNLCTQN